MRITVLLAVILVPAAPVMGMVVPSGMEADAAAAVSGAVLSGGYEYEDESGKMFFIIGGVIFVFAMIVTM